MKENRYDDELFFAKYGKMYRSVYGLKGAGEWPQLQKMLPDFTGKRVLDLGCGFGWHCMYAYDAGASSIMGVDISAKMLQKAEALKGDRSIVYQRMAIEDVEMDKESVDIVLSSLALHYVKDYAALMRRIYDWLTPQGHLVFSIEHPIFTAQGPQDWVYDEQGQIDHFPVDHYFYEGKRNAIFLGEQVIKYHRTLTTYLQTLLSLGFVIDQVVEPQPPKEMLDLEGMKDEMRRPMMLLIAVHK